MKTRPYICPTCGSRHPCAGLTARQWLALKWVGAQVRLWRHMSDRDRAAYLERLTPEQRDVFILELGLRTGEEVWFDRLAVRVAGPGARWSCPNRRPQGASS